LPTGKLERELTTTLSIRIGTVKAVYNAVTPNENYGGEKISITGSRLMDDYSVSTKDGYTNYGFWFFRGGTVEFNRNVTLKRDGYPDITVPAKEEWPIVNAQEPDKSLNGYWLALEGNYRIVFILQPEPGEWADDELLRERLLLGDIAEWPNKETAFPGTVDLVLKAAEITIDAVAAGGTELVITATDLVQDGYNYTVSTYGNYYVFRVSDDSIISFSKNVTFNNSGAAVGTYAADEEIEISKIGGDYFYPSGTGSGPYMIFISSSYSGFFGGSALDNALEDFDLGTIRLPTPEK